MNLLAIFLGAGHTILNHKPLDVTESHACIEIINEERVYYLDLHKNNNESTFEVLLGGRLSI